MSVNAAIEFGAVLRDVRKRRGVSLQELANNTKISVSVLNALEDGRVDRLPGGLYGRAFVRAYAREVGLEPDETVEAFLKAVPEARDDFDLKLTDSKSILGGMVSLPIIIGGVVLACLIAIILWLIFGSRVDQSALIREDIEAPAVSLSAQQPVPAAPAESITEEISSPGSNFFSGSDGQFTVSVHPTGPCWVSLTIDGDRVLARVMTDGERESYAVDNQLVLNIGDAGTFEFSINEERGRSLGGDGQVVTVEINRTNHQSFVLQR